MYVLNDGEILLRVHSFEVMREENIIPIKVVEVLAGGKVGKFIAVPKIMLHDAEDGLISEGPTVEEALSECLRKIKEMPFDKIFHAKAMEKIEIPGTLHFDLKGEVKK